MLCQVKCNILDKDITVSAVEYNENKKTELLCGRYLDKADSENDLIILNYMTAKELFEDAKSAIGRAVNLSSNMFEVVGVLKYLYSF